jgi:hypothetical protein
MGTQRSDPQNRYGLATAALVAGVVRKENRSWTAYLAEPVSGAMKKAVDNWEKLRPPLNFPELKGAYPWILMMCLDCAEFDLAAHAATRTITGLSAKGRIQIIRYADKYPSGQTERFGLFL